MSGSDSNIVVRILGDATGAKKALVETEDAGSSLGSKLGGVGIAAAAGLATVGAVAVGVAAKCVDSYQNLADGVLNYQRVAGGTAEQDSRLLGGAQILGVSQDTLTKAIAKTTIAVGSHSKALVDLGVKTLDASGKTRSANDIFNDTIVALSKDRDVTDRNTKAKQIFGKSYADILPLISQAGKLQGAENEAQADGLVLNQSQIEAVHKNAEEHRQMSAAIQGVSVQIGEYLYPLVTKVTTWFAEAIPKAIAIAKYEFESHRQTIQKWGDKAREVFNWVKTYVVDNILPRLKQAFDVLVKVVRDVIDWFTKHKAAAIALGIAVAALISPIGTVVAAVIYAYTHFAIFHNVVLDIVNFFKNDVPAAFVRVRSFIQPFIDWLVTEWPKVSEAATHVFNTVVDIIKVAMVVVRAVIQVAWDAILAVWHTAGQNIWNIVKDIFDEVKLIVTTAINIVKGIINLVLDVINGDWSKAWGDIVSVLSAVWGLIEGTVQNAINAVLNVIGGVLSAIGNLFGVVWRGIRDAVSSVWDSIYSNVSSQINAVLGVVSGVLATIKSTWSTVWNGFVGVVDGIWAGIQASIKSGINGFISLINTAIHGVNKISGLVGIPAIPDIPKLALGGNVVGGGLAIVGDAGPELLNLPTGAKVTPLAGGNHPAAGRGQAPQHIEVNVAATNADPFQIAREIAWTQRRFGR